MSIFDIVTLPSWELIDVTIIRLSMLLGNIHRVLHLKLPAFDGNNENYKLRPWYWSIYLTPWLRKHRFRILVANSHLVLMHRPTGPIKKCHDNWEQLEYHIYDLIEEYKLSKYNND